MLRACWPWVESVPELALYQPGFLRHRAPSSYLDADERSWSHTTATICEQRYRPAPAHREMRARQGLLNPNHGDLFERTAPLFQATSHKFRSSWLSSLRPAGCESCPRCELSRPLKLMEATISGYLVSNKIIRELHDLVKSGEWIATMRLQRGHSRGTAGADPEIGRRERGCR